MAAQGVQKAQHPRALPTGCLPIWGKQLYTAGGQKKQQHITTYNQTVDTMVVKYAKQFEHG